MEQVVAHFQEYSTAYILITVCVLPILYVTRRYSMPIILYTIETLIYLVSMHVVYWVLVTLTRWFREQSSIRALSSDGRPTDAPDWGTPLLEFWNKDLYSPEWLIWLEVVTAIAIIAAVLKYRPLRFKHSRSWSFTDKTQKGQKKGPPRPPAASYGARMGSGSGGRGGRGGRR